MHSPGGDGAATACRCHARCSPAAAIELISYACPLLPGLLPRERQEPGAHCRRRQVRRGGRGRENIKNTKHVRLAPLPPPPPTLLTRIALRWAADRGVHRRRSSQDERKKEKKKPNPLPSAMLQSSPQHSINSGGSTLFVAWSTLLPGNVCHLSPPCRPHCLFQAPVSLHHIHRCNRRADGGGGSGGQGGARRGWAHKARRGSGETSVSWRTHWIPALVHRPDSRARAPRVLPSTCPFQ